MARKGRIGTAAPILSCGLKIAVVLVFATGCAACAHDRSVAVAGADARAEEAFEAARNRCATTVAETPAVQRCMRAQGWAYRLPWQ